MKKIKIAFGVIIIVLLALLIYQNKDFFFEKQILGIDLGFNDYLSPELPNVIFFLAFFLVGLFIAYIYSLLERFRSKKTIKTLNAAVESKDQMLSTLKAELQTLKGGPASEETNSVDTLEKTADEKTSATVTTTIADQ